MTPYTLAHDSGLRATILDHGGIVASLHAPDRAGRPGNVVLGLPRPEDYLTGNTPYFGAIVGRYANRIANGLFTLDGTVFRLAVNNGPNHLHGGLHGFDKQTWTVDDHGPDRLALSRTSPDGEEGYPGNLAVEVRYTLGADRLRIAYRATTDRPTVVNLTNHSYFDLSGTGDIRGHALRIGAARYLPVDWNLIPTGELAPVAGTPFDFREPTSIGRRIDEDHDQLRYAGGYDHTWVLDDSAAATVHEPVSGRILEVHTSEPGLQFYSGNFLDGTEGHARRSGFCLETHHFPDSPNQSAFPSVVLRPGAAYETWTEYRFLTDRSA